MQRIAARAVVGSPHAPPPARPLPRPLAAAGLEPERAAQPGRRDAQPGRDRAGRATPVHQRRRTAGAGGRAPLAAGGPPAPGPRSSRGPRPLARRDRASARAERPAPDRGAASGERRISGRGRALARSGPLSRRRADPGARAARTERDPARPRDGARQRGRVPPPRRELVGRHQRVHGRGTARVRESQHRARAGLWAGGVAARTGTARRPAHSPRRPPARRRVVPKRRVPPGDRAAAARPPPRWRVPLAAHTRTPDRVCRRRGARGDGLARRDRGAARAGGAAPERGTLPEPGACRPRRDLPHRPQGPAHLPERALVGAHRHPDRGRAREPGRPAAAPRRRRQDPGDLAPRTARGQAAAGRAAHHPARRRAALGADPGSARVRRGRRVRGLARHAHRLDREEGVGRCARGERGAAAARARGLGHVHLGVERAPGPRQLVAERSARVRAAGRRVDADHDRGGLGAGPSRRSRERA